MSSGGGVGLSAGVARRNERLRGLRELVRRDAAIVGVDLASARQAVVVADHDSRVLDRRMITGSPWELDGALLWARAVAERAGFARLVVACEPTSHHWKPLFQRATGLGVPLVLVNPMLVSRAREGQDFTRQRSDFDDGLIIARLASELRCFAPYQPDGPWARLRHLGARRSQQITLAGAARQSVRDLLLCAWPAALRVAKKPMDSLTLRAALTVSCDPAEIAALSYEELAERVRVTLAAWGGRRRNHAILRRFHEAAREPGGVRAERDAATERAAFAMTDWLRAHDERAEAERRMIGVLDELGFTPLIDTLPGLSAAGAAAILAETGDPARFTHPRAWVKHAGICPRANESGAYRGETRISGRGRPNLRTAAWRAIWGLLPHNGVYARRYAHLTQREKNPLNDGQARAALAAALLRQLFVMLTRRQAWNPQLAAGKEALPAAA